MNFYFFLKAGCRNFGFARKIARLIKQISRRCVLALMKAAIFFSRITKTEFDVRDEINHYYDDFFLRRNYSALIRKIFDKKLLFLDVGARGGPLEIADKYPFFFETILCEPEKQEADNLRRRGYGLIGSALYKRSGTIKFYETHRPAGSSIYRPQGPFLDFYNPDKDYYDSYAVKKTSTTECSTISEELAKLNVSELDLLKIDVQGAELDVLMGLGRYKPILMEVEIEYLPLYHDIPNAYQVCQYLLEHGYIPFALTSHDRTLCPTWGDGFFMPNWNDPRAIELIQSRENKYIALMLMFGQIPILKFVNNKIKLKNHDFIATLEV